MLAFGVRGAGRDVADLGGIVHWGEGDAFVSDGPGDEIAVGGYLGLADAFDLLEGVDDLGDARVLFLGAVAWAEAVRDAVEMTAKERTQSSLVRHGIVF